MVCRSKDAFDKITHDADKVFLVSIQTDRNAFLSGKDMKTYQMEKKRKDASLRLKASKEQRKSEDTVAILFISSDDQSSFADESTKNDMIKRNHKRLKKTGKKLSGKLKKTYFHVVFFSK